MVRDTNFSKQVEDSHIVTQALVIDNNVGCRETLCDALKKSGISENNITCVEDIGDGILIIDEHLTSGEALDFVFLDATLPDSGGLSINTIVDKCKKFHIPVFLTAFAHEYGLTKSLSMRMQGFLKKPFNYMSVRKHVERQMRVKELEHSISNFHLGCFNNAGSNHR